MADTINNGGAIAIKGFNYQKASIILIIINNYDKDGFHLIPEAEDDFQVHIDNKNIFIQVKGERGITLNKLVKNDIISKNLVPGNDEDFRKIFFWDIGSTFKNELIDVPEGNIISPLLKYSNDHKELIKAKLDLNDNQQQRLDNQFLYITPFQNDLSVAITLLLGEMVTQELSVNKEIGRALLAELCLMIDQKSEIPFQETDFSEKKIDAEYIKKLFFHIEQMDLFNEILEKSNYNTFQKSKIKLERNKILIAYQNTKHKVLKHFEDNSLDFTGLEDDLIAEVIELIKAIDNTINDDNLLAAISIECLCCLWREGS